MANKHCDTKLNILILVAEYKIKEIDANPLIKQQIKKEWYDVINMAIDGFKSKLITATAAIVVINEPYIFCGDGVLADCKAPLKKELA